MSKTWFETRVILNRNLKYMFKVEKNNQERK